MKTRIVALILSAGCCLQAAETRKPNLLVFYADDLGYHELGCCGRKEYRSPKHRCAGEKTASASPRDTLGTALFALRAPV